MALYTERNFNDISADWEEMQRRELERQQRQAAEQYAAAQSNLSNQQQNKPGLLESVLSGIGNSVKNVGDSLYNMFGTGAASVRDILTGNIGTGKYTKEWEKYAKKTIYGDENMSDKDYYAKTGGKALDAAATVSDLIPGLGAGAKVALNVGQGAASGAAQNFIDNGANVTLEDILKGAGVGAASAGVGQYVGGKLAGSNALPKALNNNIGKAALTGAASGATGGALASSLNGGDLMQNLGAAAQGAAGGAVGGATMAGAMGLAGAGLDKLNNKLSGQTTMPDTTVETTTKPTLDPIKEAALDRKYTIAKQKQGQALMAQYGTIDAPTARSVGDAGQVLTNLYDDYGLKTPAEVQYAAKKLTGADGAVTKLTRKLAASAGDIPATYNAADIDQLIIDSGLGLDSTRGKALKQQITSIIQSTNMSGPDTANANDVLDMVKKLERKSADVAGKSGNNYHRATSEDLAAASVLNAVASDYKDRIWNGAQDISTVLTDDAIKDLKAIFPKNDTYQKGVDNKISKAKNGQELRHAMADLVNGSKIANNSKMMAGTTGAQMVKAATSANPIVAGTQMLATKALDSDTANKIRADKYAKQAQKAMSKLTGETTPSAGIIGKVKTGANDLASALNNDTVYNASYAGLLPSFGDVMTSQVARQSGLSAARDLNNEQKLKDAQQQAQDAQNNYNNVVAQTQAEYANAMQPAQVSTGQGQLDRIANAMELALNAGDITAYSQLADLYQQAQKIYGAETKSNSPYSNLSSTQLENINKMDTASNAIDELEALFNQAGGGQGLLGGNFANWMGSLGLNSDVATYNALSRGLINQIGAAIGKTDSLNTEGEVNRALELIPKMTDDQQTAQNKLAQLRQMLNANKQTMYQNYGVAQ